ncbi:MAG: hypothetical protein M3081_01205 [Gemmatimonadota bacterium]|nr:hypothetical protein [Gemmatimonadota bacterium]
MRRIALAVTMAVATAYAAGCKESVVPNLNGPTQDQFSVVNTRAQLQALATGLANADRASHGFEVLVFETIGRDLVRFDPAEPRYISRLLGATLSTSDFIGNSIWGGPYVNIRGVDLMIAAVSASTGATPTPLTDAEKQAAIGYANTIKAQLYIRINQTRDTLGEAIMVNPTSQVPIRCKPAVLAYISSLLDSAATQLKAGGGAFPFSLPTGFAGFNTPAGFLKFNRALKAEVELYRGFSPNETGGPTAAPVAANLTTALAVLDSSYYNPTPSRAALDVGIYHTYSTASGETSNPLFDVSVFRANAKVITEPVFGGAEPGDLRVQAKVDTASTNRQSTSGSGTTLLASRYLLRAPSSPSSPIALQRNEELVLWRALILWGLNRDAEAIQMVNVVRTAAGLPAATVGTLTFAASGYVGLSSHQLVLRQILHEVRYSLLFESPDRAIFYRMLGIEAELTKERNQNALAVLPIPNNESVARSGVIACTP